MGGQADRSGKYLTFVLNGESYGLEILKVREIIGLMPITPVPGTPGFVRGVVNLRGRIIPIVDLRAKFGLEQIEQTPQSCIIVIDVPHAGELVSMGILVDSVSEVLHIGASAIEDAPEFGIDTCLESILGIAKTESGIKILLDIHKVLGAVEVHNLDKAVIEGETKGVAI